LDESFEHEPQGVVECELTAPQVRIQLGDISDSRWREIAIDDVAITSTTIAITTVVSTATVAATTPCE
jgi:hypothetical protein